MIFRKISPNVYLRTTAKSQSHNNVSNDKCFFPKMKNVNLEIGRNKFGKNDRSPWFVFHSLKAATGTCRLSSVIGL